MSSYSNNQATLERMIGSLLQPRIARAISSVLVLILASACLVIANDLKKTFWNKQTDLVTSSETSPEKTAPTKTQSANTINQLYLFGQATQQQPTATPTPITAPETRLNLKLNGIISSDGENTAGAIIEKSAGKQEYFSLGDTISNGVTLKEVYKDRIILSRNGRLETLSLPKTNINANINTDTRVNTRMTNPVINTIAPKTEMKTPDPALANMPPPSVSRDAKDTKKLLEKYREMVLERQKRLKKTDNGNN
ncbi:MAG: hypothetical protein OEX83_06090 [Gammaproteobacteria bacterium]|nr:hypothetical protein [Gammaproteobacteria bacterium]